MYRSNPIIDDYKLLLVYRNIGLQLLQQVKAVMTMPLYTSFFKGIAITEENALQFSYLQCSFKTCIEVFFDYSKMPKTALLATYFLHDSGTEEIISYAFDLDYNVNDIYTLSNFAEHYLIDFHQNLKKSFSENHKPFAVKITDK